MSSAQKRLYFLQQMDLNSTSYNIPLVLPVEKKTNKNRVKASLKKLIARHESLRTSVELVNDEPVQRIHETKDIDFSIDYYETDETGAKGIVGDYIRPFNLTQAPLIRSAVIKMSSDHHIFLVDIHHIVSDGTSHTILAEDFAALYDGENLEPLRIHYKDFAHWQNHWFASGWLKSQENYWMNLFSHGAGVPRLQLSTDYKRPEVFTFEGDRYVGSI